MESMKHDFDTAAVRRIALNMFLSLVIGSLILPAASTAGDATDTDHEVISLTAKDEPLGDVLKKISMATGYEISLSDEWQHHPITVSLDKVPLDKGLERILRNLNNAIIYSPDHKIQIIVYGISATQSVSPGPATGIPLNEVPVHGRSASQDIEKDEGSGVEDKSSDSAPGRESKPRAPLGKWSERHPLKDLNKDE